jgi:hypothetical protein
MSGFHSRTFLIYPFFSTVDNHVSKEGVHVTQWIQSSLNQCYPYVPMVVVPLPGAYVEVCAQGSVALCRTRRESAFPEEMKPSVLW